MCRALRTQWLGYDPGLSEFRATAVWKVDFRAKGNAGSVSGTQPEHEGNKCWLHNGPKTLPRAPEKRVQSLKGACGRSRGPGTSETDLRLLADWSLNKGGVSYLTEWDQKKRLTAGFCSQKELCCVSLVTLS